LSSTLVVLAVMLSTTLAACTGTASALPLATDDAAVQKSQTLAGELSDSEAEGILYMREEEKLARDVYLTLYAMWEFKTFDNIASSEQTHMDAIKTLIDRYDLDDPAEGKGVGEFTNQALQELYDQLVEEGSQSLENALKVGAAVEEIDILDLQQHIAQTDRGDIQRVYENLLKGSRNHLRAFVSAIERRGWTYQPQYLSQEVFDEIINGLQTPHPFSITSP
jgi:hypothetical protein